MNEGVTVPMKQTVLRALCAGLAMAVGFAWTAGAQEEREDRRQRMEERLERIAEERGVSVEELREEMAERRGERAGRGGPGVRQRGEGEGNPRPGNPPSPEAMERRLEALAEERGVTVEELREEMAERRGARAGRGESNPRAGNPPSPEAMEQRLEALAERRGVSVEALREEMAERRQQWEQRLEERGGNPSETRGRWQERSGEGREGRRSSGRTE